MMISRGANLLNHISKHANRKNILMITQPTRLSHDWSYRGHANPHKASLIGAEISGAAVICWVLYRMFYDYKHITGHWEYPDVSKWTDEELGIPPDDSD